MQPKFIALKTIDGPIILINIDAIAYIEPDGNNRAHIYLLLNREDGHPKSVYCADKYEDVIKYLPYVSIQ